MKNTIFIDGEEYTENDIRELLNKHEHNCQAVEKLKKGRIKPSTKQETNFNQGAVIDGS
ncbi:hypothetical protein SDC9_07481 [bioreactor metagenome]|uniref:Uncharacterized protein n=1 Tax=bioreactor metagenome TaxID=1076179 RepID=A0A644T6T9_9ZZZZ|nr:hypothetical protein [Methanobrevibacter sp.]MEA4956935.1 hypothetical protein [Methanobrevibacter sp.]